MTPTSTNAKPVTKARIPSHIPLYGRFFKQASSLILASQLNRLAGAFTRVSRRLRTAAASAALPRNGPCADEKVRRVSARFCKRVALALPVYTDVSEPLGCVLDVLLESTCVARFAAETSFPIGSSSDGGEPCGATHSPAFWRKGEPTLQHGLERWLVRREVVALSPFQNRGTRETP